MSRQKPRITSIEKLLETLYVSRDDRTKTSATLFANSTTRKVLGSLDDPSDFFVRESFDSGGGHSGAFSQEDCAVEESVFHQATGLGYLRGKLKPGRVSDTEFVISDKGVATHLENARVTREKTREEILSHLFVGKGMHVCDLKPYFPALSSGDVVRAVEELVDAGRVTSHMQDDQTFYVFEPHH